MYFVELLWVAHIYSMIAVVCTYVVYLFAMSKFHPDNAEKEETKEDPERKEEEPRRESSLMKKELRVSLSEEVKAN